jgi:hypothetical protein
LTAQKWIKHTIDVTSVHSHGPESHQLIKQRSGFVVVVVGNSVPKKEGVHHRKN